MAAALTGSCSVLFRARHDVIPLQIQIHPCLTVNRFSGLVAPRTGECFSVCFSMICGFPAVEQAFHDFYYLERACANQAMALSSSQTLPVVSQDRAIDAQAQYNIQAARWNCTLRFSDASGPKIPVLYGIGSAALRSDAGSGAHLLTDCGWPASVKEAEQP